MYVHNIRIYTNFLTTDSDKTNIIVLFEYFLFTISNCKTLRLKWGQRIKTHQCL